MEEASRAAPSPGEVFRAAFSWKGALSAAQDHTFACSALIGKHGWGCLPRHKTELASLDSTPGALQAQKLLAACGFLQASEQLPDSSPPCLVWATAQRWNLRHRRPSPAGLGAWRCPELGAQTSGCTAGLQQPLDCFPRTSLGGVTAAGFAQGLQQLSEGSLSCGGFRGGSQRRALWVWQVRQNRLTGVLSEVLPLLHRLTDHTQTHNRQALSHWSL